jgi:hypothetical protein
VIWKSDSSGGGGAQRVTNLSGVESSERMHPEYGSRLERVEDAFLQHQFGAAFLARGRTFLCRLKNENYRALKLCAHRGQYGSDAQNRSDMNVVATGVGHANVFAVNGRAHRRSEGVRGVLGDLQRVEFRSHRDDWSLVAACQGPYHAGVRDPGADIEAERPQLPGDNLRRLELAVCEFRMLMNLAPQPDHLRSLPANGRSDGRVQDRVTQLTLGGGGPYTYYADKKSEKRESDCHSLPIRDP